MRLDNTIDLPKSPFIDKGIAGFALLAFVLSQLTWPLRVSAQDTLRQQPSAENKSGLEELEVRLQGQQETFSAGLEEKVAPEVLKAFAKEAWTSLSLLARESRQQWWRRERTESEANTWPKFFKSLSETDVLSLEVLDAIRNKRLSANKASKWLGGETAIGYGRYRTRVIGLLKQAPDVIDALTKLASRKKNRPITHLDMEHVASSLAVPKGFVVRTAQLTGLLSKESGKQDVMEVLLEALKTRKGVLPSRKEVPSRKEEFEEREEPEGGAYSPEEVFSAFAQAGVSAERFPAQVPTLVTYLGAGSPDIKRVAGTALIAFAKAGIAREEMARAVPRLVKYVRRPQHQRTVLQVVTVELLVTLGEHGIAEKELKKAVPTLLGLITRGRGGYSSETYQLRERVKHLIVRFSEKRVVPETLAAQVPILVDLLSDDDVGVRRVAQEILGAFVNNGIAREELAPAVLPLVANLSAGEGKKVGAVRGSAEKILITLIEKRIAREAFVQAVPVLVDYLKDPKTGAGTLGSALRILAALAHQRIPKKNLKVAVRPLISRLRDKDIGLRNEAQETLNAFIKAQIPSYPELSLTIVPSMENRTLISHYGRASAADETLEALTKLDLPAPEEAASPEEIFALRLLDLLKQARAGDGRSAFYLDSLSRLGGSFGIPWSLSHWEELLQLSSAIFASTTDYNRDRILSLLFNPNHLDWLKRQQGADPLRHLAFYSKILSTEKRLAYQVLEGLLDGMRKERVDAALPSEERERILRFVTNTRSFNPVLFTAFKRDGEEALQRVFLFSKMVLRDQVGSGQIERFTQGYTQRDFNKLELLTSAIQTVIPASGASFVARKEIEGLLSRYIAAGDLRGHIPLLLMDKDFGEGEKDAITLTEWSLKPGQTFDPEGRVAQLLSDLRHKDQELSREEKERRQEEDKEKLKESLLEYFTDRSPPEKEAVLKAFYAYVSHNDQLGEKVDRIQLGEYQGVSLLEQLFVDKDNLASLFLELLKEIDPSLLSQVPTEAAQPIANPRAMARQLEGIWGSGVPDKEDRIVRILRGTSPQDLQFKLLPLLAAEALRKLVQEFSQQPPATRVMTPHELLEEIFQEPVLLIQKEKDKFETKELERKIVLEFRVVKGIPYGLWGINCGVCIAFDLELWRDSRFLLLAMIDRESGRVVGFAHLFQGRIQEGDETREILLVPGIEPSVEFLSEVRAREVYPLIEKALLRIAQEGDYDALYLPTNPQILSNRPDIVKEVQKRYTRTKQLPSEIHWSHWPVAPFKEVYKVWNRSAGLEEGQIENVLKFLDEALQGGPGILVIEAAVISRRMGLSKFVARVPQRLGDRIILFGRESIEAKEIAARNGITLVDSDRLTDLVLQLLVLGEEANNIGYLGDPAIATSLSEILPRSMEVTPFDPVTALSRLLLFLGYPQPVLDGINASGLEEQFARSRAA